MTQKKPYHHGSLKDALIAAGIDILESRGLDQLSLRAIAAHVGVSHTAPKNHFGNLRGLLTAIATTGFHRHADFMRQGIMGEERKSHQIAAMRGYVRFAQTHPQLFRLMFSASLCNFDDPGLSAASAESYGVLRGVAAGLDWDKATAQDADLRSEVMLWSIVHGYATLALAGMVPPYEIAEIMPDFGYLDRPPVTQAS
jgi:AcrR family transcriptional regulator